MAQRDPFSWASEYAQTQHQHAAREGQNAQNALMGVFAQEAARQRPWSDLPVDMARQNNASALNRGNFEYKERYKAAARANAPIPPGDIARLITDAAKAHGFDPDIMLTVAGLESGFNPRAKNPHSTAAGLWQQLDSNAAQYGVRNKLDPVEATAGAMRYSRDVVNALQRNGLPVTAGTFYLTYQQGPGNGPKLLKNPNAPVEAVIGVKAARQNGARPGMTAGQFADMWVKKADAQYNARISNRKDYVERTRYSKKKEGLGSGDKSSYKYVDEEGNEKTFSMTDLPKPDDPDEDE